MARLGVQWNYTTGTTPVRTGEPVSAGLPWPRGVVPDDHQFHLVGPDGCDQPLQTRVLARWPDGSVKWCLFDFLAVTTGPGQRVELRDTPRPAGGELAVTDTPTDVTIDTGVGTVTIHTAASIGVTCTDAAGRKHEVTFSVELLGQKVPGDVRFRCRTLRVTDHGPIRVAVEAVVAHYEHADGTGVNFSTHYRIEAFRNVPVIRVTHTIRNESDAAHPGGNWDLGAMGSMCIRNTECRVTPPAAAECLIAPEPGVPARQGIYLHQASSGGDNWDGVNHIDRFRNIPLTFRGYHLADNAATTTGLRATPVASVGDTAIVMSQFWQNFPKAVSYSDEALSLGLFPTSDVGHELQGGEQKTHTFHVAFGKCGVTTAAWEWCREPLIVSASPAWYAATGVIPYLTPKAGDPNGAYLALVDQAIEGPDTFAMKREAIDEYGWRHFGDIYGDHEAVQHAGPKPMVSHYNNQYDCVAGFALQYLRSGNPAWFAQMRDCARHTVDIDIYHTTRDKAAYNGGLFWHTYHYAPADTGTHRSYPKSLRTGPQGSLTDNMQKLGETAAKLQKAYAVGGGPAASHNYNFGLMLAYYLTGEDEYRKTAIDLADFVFRVEDPAKTPFRFLSRRATGLASESGGGGYHGPGRAAGNSISALVIGHTLTGEAKYLTKADELIRRVVSPNQNLARLDLLNAETRWFYTMTLQAIGEYLDHVHEIGAAGPGADYARASLLHYAAWMAANEKPILDSPDKLQYPTETWAAQEIRKVEVFQYAAKYAPAGGREQYLERADWFFRYIERTLPTFKTKSLCRPVILMMRYGWSRAWWMTHDHAKLAPRLPALPAATYPPWAMFVPQKVVAMKRAKLIAAGLLIVGGLGVVGLGWYFFG